MEQQQGLELCLRFLVLPLLIQFSHFNYIPRAQPHASLSLPGLPGCGSGSRCVSLRALCKAGLAPVGEGAAVGETGHAEPPWCNICFNVLKLKVKPFLSDLGD